MKDLINEDSKNWNPLRLQEIYCEVEAARVSNTFIPASTRCDKLVWSKAHNGNYSVALGYKTLLDEAHSSNMHVGMFPFPWKDFWKIKLPMRILLFGWKLLHHAIPCGEILNRHHLPGNFLCSFCGGEPETLNHLFLHCHFSKAFWFGSPISLRVDDLLALGVVDWFASFCRDALTMQDHRLTMVPWILTGFDIIWQARNNCVWKGMRADPSDCVTKQMAMMTRYNEAFSKPLATVQNRGMHRHITVITHNDLQHANGVVFGWKKHKNWTLFMAAVLKDGEIAEWRAKKKEKKKPRNVDLLIFIRDVFCNLQDTSWTSTCGSV